MNRLKLMLLLVGILVAVVLVWLAVRAWGAWAGVGMLATAMTGLGAATRMSKVTRDEGRATRGDLGARGTETIKTKTKDGVVEKTVRRRPRRGGTNWF